MALSYKVEKIPSLRCKRCSSTHVIMTDNGPECDDCDRPSVWVRDEKLNKIERCDSIKSFKEKQ